MRKIYQLIPLGLLSGLVVLTGCTLPSQQVAVPSDSKYCNTNGTFTDAMPIQSHRSYCVQTVEAHYEANTPTAFTFSIVDDQGNTLKDFALTHTQLMHVIVVREDLQYFQHLHPEFNAATGEFTLADLTFPADGIYRIFADFQPNTDGKLPVTSYVTATVGLGADYIPVALEAEQNHKIFEGYEVHLGTGGSLTAGAETKLSFSLMHDGQPVTDLQEYLGALGHSVILKEGTLDFIHAHPVQDTTTTQTGTVDFLVTFPEAGNYKVFTQFKPTDQVMLTDFVVSVAEGDHMMTPTDGDNMHTAH